MKNDVVEKNINSCDVMPCNPVEIPGVFGEGKLLQPIRNCMFLLPNYFCPEHRVSMFLRNVREYIPN
jgi:hypothetical protein